MLVAIVDCLVPQELACLVSSLTRDGILCLPAGSSIDVLHDTISTQTAVPIVIHGKDSLHVPYTDCPRLWLCCGPTTDDDIVHATTFWPHDVSDTDLRRREKAMCCAYERVTYVDALVFMADVVAKQCVSSMGVGERAAEIILRHVKKPSY